MTVTSTRPVTTTGPAPRDLATVVAAFAVGAVAAPVDHTERARCRRVARAALVEDVEWLAETGETRLRAARRVGMTPTSLQRALFRAERADLWQRLTGPIA